MARYIDLSRKAHQRYEELRKKAKTERDNAEPFLLRAQAHEAQMQEINQKLEIVRSNLKRRAKVELGNPKKGGRSAKERAKLIKKELAKLKFQTALQRIKLEEREKKLREWKLILIEEARRR